jgi:hypothetical protein
MVSNEDASAYLSLQAGCAKRVRERMRNIGFQSDFGDSGTD